MRREGGRSGANGNGTRKKKVAFALAFAVIGFCIVWQVFLQGNESAAAVEDIEQASKAVKEEERNELEKAVKQEEVEVQKKENENKQELKAAVENLEELIKKEEKEQSSSDHHHHHHSGVVGEEGEKGEFPSTFVLSAEEKKELEHHEKKEEDGDHHRHHEEKKEEEEEEKKESDNEEHHRHLFPEFGIHSTHPHVQQHLKEQEERRHHQEQQQQEHHSSVNDKKEEEEKKVEQEEGKKEQEEKKNIEEEKHHQTHEHHKEEKKEEEEQQQQHHHHQKEEKKHHHHQPGDTEEKSEHAKKEEHEQQQFQEPDEILEELKEKLRELKEEETEEQERRKAHPHLSAQTEEEEPQNRHLHYPVNPDDHPTKKHERHHHNNNNGEEESSSSSGLYLRPQYEEDIKNSGSHEFSFEQEAELAREIEAEQHHFERERKTHKDVENLLHELHEETRRHEEEQHGEEKAHKPKKEHHFPEFSEDEDEEKAHETKGEHHFPEFSEDEEEEEKKALKKKKAKKGDHHDKKKEMVDTDLTSHLSDAELEMDPNFEISARESEDSQYGKEVKSLSGDKLKQLEDLERLSSRKSDDEDGDNNNDNSNHENHHDGGIKVFRESDGHRDIEVDNLLKEFEELNDKGADDLRDAHDIVSVTFVVLSNGNYGALKQTLLSLTALELQHSTGWWQCLVVWSESEDEEQNNEDNNNSIAELVQKANSLVTAGKITLVRTRRFTSPQSSAAFIDAIEETQGDLVCIVTEGTYLIQVLMSQLMLAVLRDPPKRSFYAWNILPFWTDYTIVLMPTRPPREAVWGSFMVQKNKLIDAMKTLPPGFLGSPDAASQVAVRSLKGIAKSDRSFLRHRYNMPVPAHWNGLNSVFSWLNDGGPSPGEIPPFYYNRAAGLHEKVPFLSVVVSTFQRKLELLNFVQSFVLQSDADWEMIIVNDGPDEEKGDLLAKWFGHDPRIRYQHTPTRANQFGHNCRELGLQRATGRWVLITNDDNYYAPPFVAHIRSAAERETTAKMLVFDMVISNMHVNGYEPFRPILKLGSIDMGTVIVERGVAQENGFPYRGHDDDFTFFNDCGKKIMERKFKIAYTSAEPGHCYWVHN